MLTLEKLGSPHVTLCSSALLAPGLTCMAAPLAWWGLRADTDLLASRPRSMVSIPFISPGCLAVPLSGHTSPLLPRDWGPHWRGLGARSGSLSVFLFPTSFSSAPLLPASWAVWFFFSMI